MLSPPQPGQPRRQHQRAAAAASASEPPRANQGEDGTVDFVLPDCGLRCKADGHVYSSSLHAPLGQAYMFFSLLYVVVVYLTEQKHKANQSNQFISNITIHINIKQSITHIKSKHNQPIHPSINQQHFVSCLLPLIVLT